MASDWNRLMDRLARLGLGEHEQRVLAAIARKTLGYRKQSDKLPISQLVDITGLDRRHVSRALEQLAARGLITRTGGTRGRGNAATITLILDPEKAPREATKKKRTTGHIQNALNVPLEMTEKSPPEAHSRGKGVKKNALRANDELRRTAFEQYLAAGGNLLLVRERNALAGAIGRAVKAGHDHDLILDAVRDLGRNQEFPGLLTQRITDFKTNGRPCTWAGIGRLNLTVPQLTECGCPRCTERAQTLAAAAPDSTPDQEAAHA